MANNKQNNVTPLPSEYQNLARVEDVSAIDEKVKNCYSKDRYEDFQEAVEKIALRGMDGVEEKKKIKTYATEAMKDYNEKRGLKVWAVYLPIVIAIIALIFAALTYFKS